MSEIVHVVDLGTDAAHLLVVKISRSEGVHNFVSYVHDREECIKFLTEDSHVIFNLGELPVIPTSAFVSSSETASNPEKTWLHCVWSGVFIKCTG